MDQSPIKKSFICLIVPFAYRVPFSECINRVNSDHFELKDIKADRLFDYAGHLVSADHSRHEAIGKRWMMRQAARKTFGLPHNYHHPMSIRAKQQQRIISINEIQLYLFETQTGFLAYHIEFHGVLTIDEQVEAIYYLKKLMNYSHEIAFEQRVSKETSISNTVQLSEMSRSILQELDIATFFEGEMNHPTEALVYSSVLLGSSKKEVENSIGSYLFHMRRSFKASYKASAAEHDLNGNQDMLTLFENSCWGISLEGLGNIATATDDEVTNEFFGSTYFHHVENTYLYLYILALHQKYALHYLTVQASELSHHLHMHQNNPAEQSQILIQMKERIVTFLLRSSYKQVSRSTHHALFYEWIRSRLKIDDMFSEIHEALEALVSLTVVAEKKQRQEEDERKRREAERFNKKITGISAVFLPLSIVTGIYGMNLSWLDPIKEPWVISLLALGTYLLTFILFKYWFNKE
ncbi:CorA family divalent cation transporter [Paenibacillus sp. GCM10028914]|uniref:CorA family divalent cation transporter n=1 Tax=Paenibacillus sp. GCM10028914 TaxID=3273416 RepID=UPI003619B2C8